jgi:hypothetical protein
MHELDGARQIAPLEVLKCGFALLERSTTEQDDVRAVFEEEKGEGEADASVCWVGWLVVFEEIV